MDAHPHFGSDAEAEFATGRRRVNGATYTAAPDAPDRATSDDPGADGREYHGPDDDAAAGRYRRLRPLTVAEIRSASLPSWLVRGLLPQRSLALVFGASGSGKSFLTIDMVCAVARGLRWFGRRTKRTRVVYVAGEGHLKARLDAYATHHAIADDELDGVRALVANVNLLGVDGDRGELVRELRATAADVGGVGIVVLDTLNSMMPGGDENSSEDMGSLIAAARHIMAALECTVIVVHHCGKDSTKGARGHSSLRAAVDAEIEVSDTGGVRAVKVTKMRDGETGQEILFRLRAVDLGPNPDPDADDDERLTSCVVESADAEDRREPVKRRLPKGSELAFKALREAIAEFGRALPGTSAIPAGVRAVNGDTWRRRYNALDAIDADADDTKARTRAADARLKRFTRARNELQAAEMVGGWNDHYWLNR